MSISLLAPHDYNPGSLSSFIYPYKSSPPSRLPPLPSYHNDPDEALETYPITTAPSPPPPPSDPEPEPHRENATFFMLTTNSESDIRGTVQSVRELEDRFNHKYNYPWIFLNDRPFSDEFKSYALRRLVSSQPVWLTDVRPPNNIIQVASPSSSQDPSISRRSPRRIGICPRGSTRQR